MPIKKVTDDMVSEMKILFVRGLLPCDEIAGRMGISRQTVAVALRKIGVDTTKKKIVLDCDTCGRTISKTRYEMRQHENHFCSNSCYSEYIVSSEYQDEHQKTRRWMSGDDRPFGIAGYENPYPFFRNKNTLVFKSRGEFLEWKRTGLPKDILYFPSGNISSSCYKNKGASDDL